MGRKVVAKPNRESCPEIGKWMRLKSLTDDDTTTTSACNEEAQNAFKIEILNGLRELQKENDETAWMYKNDK